MKIIKIKTVVSATVFFILAKNKKTFIIYST